MTPLPSKKWGLVFLGLLAVALFVYGNSWKVPFQFDDDSNILSNVSIHSAANIPALWAENIKTRFLPYCSFALNYLFNKDLVFGYHLLNFVIHVFNALWVYLLVLFLFRAPKVRDVCADKNAELLAVFSALIFLSHPLQTQAVTYIVQRITAMAAFFYLGAVVFYVRSRLGGKRSDYALALAMTVAAMFCKENAFTLPLVLVLTEGMFFGFPKGEGRKSLGRLLPFLLTMAIIPYYIREASEQLVSGGFLPMQKNALPRIEYFLTEMNVLRTYLRLFFFPVNQNLDYDYPAARSFLEAGTLFSYLLLAGLLAAAFKLIEKHRLLAFGIFWFFLTLSVESSVLPINDVIFEHRMYLPLVGCAVFLSVALFFFLEKRKHFIVAGTVVVLVFSSMAYVRNEVWQSDISLWSDVVKKAPKKARGYNNLGQAYSTRKGGDGKAKEFFEKAIALDPEYPQPYYNLGVICDGKGESEKAKAFYEKAIALDPEYLSPVNNLAILYGQQGELDRAIETLRKALKVSPLYVVGHDNLGVAYEQKGDMPQAIESFEEALRINPYYPPAYVHLGIILKKQGELEKAEVLFRKAGELDPTYPDPVLELGKLQAQKGEMSKVQEAILKLKQMQQVDMASQLEAALSGGAAQGEAKGGFQMRKFGPESDDSQEMSEKDKKLRKIMRQVKLVQQVRQTQAIQSINKYAAVRPAVVSPPVSAVIAVRAVKEPSKK